MIKPLIFILFTFPVFSFCQTNNGADSLKNSVDEKYNRIKPIRFITNVPGNIWQVTKLPVKKNNLKTLLITAGATALLIPLDQKITQWRKAV